jgi:hypothetical protein
MNDIYLKLIFIGSVIWIIYEVICSTEIMGSKLR